MLQNVAASSPCQHRLVPSLSILPAWRCVPADYSRCSRRRDTSRLKRRKPRVTVVTATDAYQPQTNECLDQQTALLLRNLLHPKMQADGVEQGDIWP